MSDSENDPLNDLLSSFALGPAWARATGSDQKSKSDFKSAERKPRREDRETDDRRGGPPRDRDGGRRPQQGRDRKSDDRRAGPPRHEEILPADGVRVTLTPDAAAVHLIGKEVHQVARAYPLFDVAKILLAERGRCRAVFEAPEPHAPLFRGKLDDSVFLTREEAVLHIWGGALREQFIEEETIEVDPPKGNFLLVAKCGISGEWLGPPNFHAYQVNLRRLHRERFPNMPFAAYSAKVRTERGEEAVAAWMETMKQKTRWRIKGDADDAWIDDRAEAERALATRCFDQAFEETRCVEVPASIDPKNLSPSLMLSLKLAGNHARNHPAVLIPAVCKAVEAEHLPVFKRKGKLFTGPARPQPLPVGASLAVRPAIMVEWIRANTPAKLEGLWKAVLPEGATAPPADFAADLFWLLNQGHILLFTDDTLVVQEVREAPAAEPGSGKKKKKKSKKAKAEGAAAVAGGADLAETPEDREAAVEPTPVEPESPAEIADVPNDASEEIVEAPVEAPVDSTEVPSAEAALEEAPAAVEAPASEPMAEANDDLSKNPSPGVDESPAL